NSGAILHYLEGTTCDLTVASDGCCPISVEWNGTPHMVDAGDSDTFALDCGTDVTLTAVPSDSCDCDDIELDGVSQGCDPVIFHMDGNDHVVDVCCVEQAPIPEPCSWCIYEVWWWENEEPPVGDPDNREYHCLHCVEWLPPEHIEVLDEPIGMHVIPDPSFHQDVYFYGGPEPNGYPEAEWEPLFPVYEHSGLSRHTIFFGILEIWGMRGLSLWSSDSLINWKTWYDWIANYTMHPPWSVTLDVIPVSGSPGWPWAVGDAWITIGMSHISPPIASYHECSSTENVTTPLFPGGIECYRVESYSWIDVNGDGVPDPGELTPSSTDWWNNDYGCSIKKETYPGAIYMGWEHFYMVWYGPDPTFPPWEPTYNLTVDQSASCCSVDVGAPVGATVAAGTSQTFTDLEYEVVISVYADDSDPCCVFDSWLDGGAQTHDVYMDGDKSVTATCDWLDSDLTVNSIGCCNVTVEGLNEPVNIPAGQSKTFTNIPCCTDVTVTAITTDDCFCDDIAFDGASQGCDPVIFNMDGNDHVVDVCCREYAPSPPPCCWCIYSAEWWFGEDPPAGDPHRREYHCLHCVEWLPPKHTEDLGLLGMYTIADPSFHQECTFYGGPAPNGYGVAEWDTLPGLVRWNIILGYLYLGGIGYWNSQLDLLNWKTRYDVWNMGGTITLYSCTLQVIPVSGNPGWPYAVGNSWINIDMSHISPPAASYHECSSTENVTTPLFPGGIECYRVESYSWIDVNGIDDDGDGAVDEDPFNQYDDDSDGLTDEDGGDGVPDPGELTPSSTNWWNNDYGCSIKKETYPGAMYMGWERFYMLWYGTDPPFPPWEPTYNLTVDQSASCCSVDVGAPVGATVAAGTSQTFTDLECEVIISVYADDSAPCCDFDQWTGDTDLSIYMNSNQVTMDGDKLVTATCVEPTYDLTVDQSESCCPVIVGLPSGDETVVAGVSQVFDDICCNTTINLEAITDGCCTFGNWTGNVADPGCTSTSITMYGDETVTAECSEATPAPWDVNGDGNVNEDDMNLVYDHFGEEGDEGWIREDVNENGRIDVLDMILVGQHWTG
ncbi:MAG: dockerin type I domain-containing protein, partial [Dehalococcoidia bacterium]